jgi:hypothetical protein
VPRKWGGSGSEKEDEILDFSAPASSKAGDGVHDLAADMSKASLVDQEEAVSDSEDEGEPPVPITRKNTISHIEAFGLCRRSQGRSWHSMPLFRDRAGDVSVKTLASVA